MVIESHSIQANNILLLFMFQVLTTVAGRYTFPQLARFNPEHKTTSKAANDKSDKNDEIDILDLKEIPKWNPPITNYRVRTAKKDSIRRGHILALPVHVKRFCWRLSDVQVKIMFEFFSSAKSIQNVAYGTIKSKDQFGNDMVMSKVIRLSNKTDLVANCLSYFKEIGVLPPDRSTIFHYLSECFPGNFC